MMNRFVSLAAIAAFTLITTAAHAADPADKCQSGKLKESAKYASCLLKAESKAVLLGLPMPDFTKCVAKFPSKFNDIETMAGTGVCPSEGDGLSIGGWITRDANDIATLLSGGTISRVPASGQTTSHGAGDDGDVEAGATLAYVDNGDGTITDVNTGLMWERKVGLGDGVFPCTDETGSCANPHDADNLYTWTAGSQSYDGRVATIFLEQLNNRCNADATIVCSSDVDCTGVGGPCGFAGHRDWRLPNMKEWMSIIDFSRQTPAVDPTFHGAGCNSLCTDVTDPACTCNASSNYWSATTYALFLTEAWQIHTNLGWVYPTSKTVDLYARAIRGGS